MVGGVKFPLSNQDFSSFLFTAQASKAKIIAITAGNWAAAVRQANEFGITAAGQKVTGLYVNLSDVKALGLKAAQGLTFVDAWYWDLNAETRAWSQRFFERTKRMPNSTHVGVYSAVRHYLKAINQAGTDNATAVAATMRALPVNDVMSKNAQVRPDGRVVRDFYLFEAKSPAESHGDWDLYKLISTIPAADVMRLLTESECPLVNARAQ